MRPLAVSMVMIGIMGVILEIEAGKVYISSAILCLVLVVLGVLIYLRNLRLKFPKRDENNMRRSRVIEDIVLVTTNDIDHKSSIQQSISKMKKNDDLLFELVTLDGKENQVKLTTTDHETLGVIPYTYPHRKFIASRIIDGATILAKVFKVSRGLKGQYKLSISVAPYEMKFISKAE